MDMESLKALAAEIRTALLNKISKCGGHLAPNLGFCGCDYRFALRF
jgi:Deoxyxylulose-5-phosphate synthase